ncbi:hypothetical protein [Nocardia sp. No.11]|uniref:hypothetical protein n=1 Tax=Nocardia sp. No.11 TaxID=3128861 RepID=UPI00319D9524
MSAGHLGAIGSVGMIAAAVADNPALLFVALFVYGARTATNSQARYAGADLAATAHPWSGGVGGAGRDHLGALLCTCSPTVTAQRLRAW